MRNLILTPEFLEYYNAQSASIQKKFDYALNVLRTMPVPSVKFVKKLIDTEFYELRISVGNNEYRTILFTVDHDNIVNATQVMLLNGFQKKSTKDYPPQIQKAIDILNSYEDETS